MEQILLPHWQAFCGESFERLCREALPHLYEAEEVTGSVQIGDYWDRSCQVDVVGLRGDGWIDLGECKWSERATPTSASTELARRIASYPSGGRTTRGHLFLRRVASRGGRTPFCVHDLSKLYGDRR